ncbi:MAG: hypothetical protein HY275_11475 [Gemmatimonadetes bacterium]|nr:hypothetical protein [Gemmatimonadota bacterium]
MMTPVRRPAQRTARAVLALAALVVASCDPKTTSTATSPTGGSVTDDIAPTVAIAAAGTNGRDTIDVNAPLSATITGTDNRNLRRLDITVKAGASQLVRDTTTNGAGSTTYARTITARLAGIPSGTQIRIIAQATDLAGNASAVDTLLLTAIDTIAPSITVNGPVAGTAYKVNDTVKVDLNVADSSGLTRVYSQFYRLSGPTDTIGTLVRTDSLVPTTGASSVRTVFPIPYTLAFTAGTYGVRVRAKDISGNQTRVPQVVIQLRDPQKPVLTVVYPTRDTTVTVGDTNFIITARATDNIQVQRIKAWGVTYRGNPALGKVDTLLRFDTVSAPIGTGSLPTLPNPTIDTTVSRRMIPVGVPSTVPETVTVFITATDQSGNDSTLTRRVFLVNRAFTQDSLPPVFDTLNVVPGNLATVTLGSNFTVSAHVTDNFGLARLAIVGFTTRGNPSLGVVDTTIRYDSVFAPINNGGPAAFRTGLTDTVITRNMTALSPVGGPDTLRLLYRLADRTGRTTTLVRKVILLSGPTVTLNAPTSANTTFPGTRIPIQVSATGPSKLIEIGYRIVNANFNVVQRIDVTAANSPTGTIFDTVTVPNAVLAGSSIRVVPFARDVVNPGVTVLGDSASVLVQVPSADVTGPLVYQSIPPRIETGDTLVVRASDPSGVKKIRYVLINDSTGTAFQNDSVVFNSPLPKDTALRARINIPLASLGSRYRFYSFAYDSVGNRANSVPITSVQPDSIRADTLRGTMAFGRTFRTANLPAGTLAGDLAVDRFNNVYISNIARNQLELWRLSDSTFRPSIPVGSQPWGLTFNRSADTIFVANSGGTNISVVDTVGKVERRRIKTPGNVLYRITQTIDASSGVTRLSLNPATDIIQYSDRPQFIAMSKNGNLYYSTRPTAAATPGTLRRIDPRQPPASTEVQQLTTYATLGPENVFIIANVDSLYITKSIKDSISDNITIFERQYGTSTQITTPSARPTRTWSASATARCAPRAATAAPCRSIPARCPSLTPPSSRPAVTDARSPSARATSPVARGASCSSSTRPAPGSTSSARPARQCAT